MPDSGTSLERGATNFRESKRPYKLGEEWSFMSIMLHNQTQEPVVLRDVAAIGEGVGDTVEIVETLIAPLPGTRRSHPPFSKSPDLAVAGVWKTLPPVYFEKGRCHVQKLVDVEGFVLDPDVEARVLFHIRAASPGKFDIDGADVTYSVNDDLVRQEIPTGLVGTISEDAGPMKVNPQVEAPCLNETKVLP